MPLTREQVGAIVWSVLLIASTLGLGTVGSVAATNQPQESVQIGAPPDDLIRSETTRGPLQTSNILQSRQSTDPIKITDWHDLNDVRNDTESGRFRSVIDQSYVLTTDLDKNTSGYESVAGPTANGGQGFNPIGGGLAFTGIFDGNGHTIADYVINRTESDGRSGLFAHSDGTIKNLHIENATVRGDNKADGRRPNIEVTGILVGAHGGLVENVTTSGTVSGGNYVGGVVGSHNNDGDGPHKINNATTSAEVTGNMRVGGIAGGLTLANVANSTATGSVTGEESVGGIAGEAAFGGSVKHSQSSANVTGESSVGGLVGELNGGVKYSESSATVSGPKEVGGAVGHMRSGVVLSSVATGQVIGKSKSAITEADIGGLVGRVNSGTSILRSAATGTVRTNASPAGGLVGRTTGDDKGVGASPSEIRASYASANVINQDPFGKTGGLVGANLYGLIEDTYATGNVTGRDQSGGLAGNNDWIIKRSYATGNVTGRSSGGLYYFNIRQTSNTYWDINTTGQSIGHQGVEDLEGGTGLPTSAMTGEEAPTNLSGFNFSADGVWRVQTGDYPILAWQRSGSIELTDKTVRNGTETVTVDNVSRIEDAEAAEYVVVVHVVNDDGSISAPVGYSTNQSGSAENISVDLNASGVQGDALDSIIKNTTLRAILHEPAADSSFGSAIQVNGSTVIDNANITVKQTLANFAVSDVTPDGANVTAGDELDISATVENTGGEDGTQSVEFRILPGDGNASIENASMTITQNVTLDAGNSTTVSFRNVSTAGLSTGEFTHGVFSANDSATATITIEDAEVNLEGSVIFSDKIVDNGTETVTVDGASLTENGELADYVVVVHVVSDEFDGGVSAPVGYSANQSGSAENIRVDLNASAAQGSALNSITENTTLRAMLHNPAADSGFGSAIQINGSTVADDANITVERADSDGDIIDRYDENGDGLETSELLVGIGDWRGGEIETQELLTLIDAWRSNSSA